MQTSRFLDEHADWERISMTNTAAAAKRCSMNRIVHRRRCSAYAAEVYGLEVLAEDINDEKSNSTRFIVVTNQKVYLKDASKISICFEVPHESGSLYQMLSHFIYNNLNMTRIESRPIEGKTLGISFLCRF